jgi:threonine dehydrogenase-like Zn-dependent dehydrogenase
VRAVVLRGGRLEVRETSDPVPGQAELLLRTLSTAICASDVHFIDHPDLGVNDPTGRSLYAADRDIVLGHEFVGEVIGHGPDCTDRFPLGARVTSIPIRLVNGGADGARIIGQHPEAQGSFGELLVVGEALAKSVEREASSDAANSHLDQQTALVIVVDAAPSYCPQYVHQTPNGTFVGPNH